MRLRFTKMHTLGKDFVVIDGLTQQPRLTPDKVRLLADRERGVGCQQILVVEAPAHPDMDFRCQLFNKDGSQATNYHHAACCLAQFVWDRRLTAKRVLRVEAAKGLGMTLEAPQKNGYVTLSLGVPQLNPAEGPAAATRHTLDCGDQGRDFTVVSLEQSHAILVVPSTPDAPLESLGRRIQEHQSTPSGVNVGFMAVLSRREIDLRVLQPDGSEALSSADGACAAVIAGRLRGLLDEEVKVRLSSGSLSIRWSGEGKPLQASSLVTTAFQGYILL